MATFVVQTATGDSANATEEAIMRRTRRIKHLTFIEDLGMGGINHGVKAGDSISVSPAIFSLLETDEALMMKYLQIKELSPLAFNL